MSRYLRFVLLAAAGMAAGACSDNPTGPGSSTPDLSALLAEMSPSSISAATTFAMSNAGPMMVVHAPFDPSLCAYSTDTGFFVCPTRTTDGLTITSMYRLIDAAGNTQSQLTNQTSAIETKMTVKGTPSSQSPLSTGGPMTLDESSDMTLSGIHSDTHILDGVSTTTMTGSFDVGGTTVPINTTMAQTTTDLVLPKGSAGQRWPQSGTIAFDETSNLLSVDPNAPETTHLVMTFNGTSVVTVTITDAFGTSTCHFDMANPGVSAGACS